MVNSFNSSAASKFYICCKNCEERTKTCHSTCPKYLKGKQMHKELKDKIESEKDVLTKRYYSRREY